MLTKVETTTMKTVTVQLSSLVSQFAAHQTDFLFDLGSDSPLEAEDNVELFLKDLRNLLNPKRGMVVSTLRRLFSEGFTMMLLAPSVFEVLEATQAEGAEFSIVVRDGKDAVCILCQAEVTW
jgi:hypothetical protein